MIRVVIFSTLFFLGIFYYARVAKPLTGEERAYWKCKDQCNANSICEQLCLNREIAQKGD